MFQTHDGSSLMLRAGSCLRCGFSCSAVGAVPYRAAVTCMAWVGRVFISNKLRGSAACSYEIKCHN